MEDAVARKAAALEHAPWTSEFPFSLICALLWPFYSGTKPTQYTLSTYTILVFVVNNFYLYML